MDFIDSLNELTNRVTKFKDTITNEGATKNVLIEPFFEALGYNVRNPFEFATEFTADVGVKKGEKVDYAILRDGEPTVLIEAKSCTETLDNHSSQLFRYFGTTTAKFAILTNGIVYKFYTDLDDVNKMDLAPYLELDLLHLRENIVAEVKQFHKSTFDPEKLFSVASELKYIKATKDFFAEQLENASEGFISYVLSEIYSGRRTQGIIEKFKPIIETSLNALIAEMMKDKISVVLKANERESLPPSVNENLAEEPEAGADEVSPTAEELECFYIVKAILAKAVDVNRITLEKRKTNLAIRLDESSKKVICRISIRARTQFLEILDGDKMERYDFQDVSGINNLDTKIINRLNTLLD